MQILIDILEDDIPSEQALMTIYLHFIDGKVCECSYPHKILPKGHGRLIDADKLQNNISHDKREAFTKHQVWLKASIYNPDAQTIIEADGGVG